MREMSEAIPLCPRLGVHCVQIIVRIPLCESLDLMLEGFATKRRLVWHVQWQTGKTSAPFPITAIRHNVLYWHNLPSPDLFSCSGHTCRREKIQTADLGEWLECGFSIRSTYVVIVPPNPSGLCRCSRNLRQLFPCGEYCAIRIPGNGCCGLVHCQEIFDLRQALTRGILRLRHDVSGFTRCN
jgi:hypothetical protein